MSTKSAAAARGMRDLLPEDMRKRRHVFDILIRTFEDFGFEPLDTPAVERASTLLGKYGPEAERLIYRVGLGRERDLALRYDLTVPTARVAASGQDLPSPFKRYQIAPVWRGERPQKGRYREFVQADIDIIGSDSLLADAEVVTVVTRLLEALGFPASRTKLNNRKLLTGIGRYAGVQESLLPGLYRSIDKLDKIGLAGVRRELLGVGLPGDLLNRQRQAVDRWLRATADRQTLQESLEDALAEDADPRIARHGIPAFLDALADFPFGAGAESDRRAEAEAHAMDAGINALRRIAPADRLIDRVAIDRMLELLQLRGEARDLLGQLEQELEEDVASQGAAEMRRVLDALDAAGVPPERYELDFAMVRGLDYYTGTIFETLVTGADFGSLTGGGRYDRLISIFGADLPAVGSSFGIDRLIDAMNILDLFPTGLSENPSRVLVTLFDDATAASSVGLASRLRSAGIPTHLSFEATGIGDQIREALKREIPLVAILGPDEIASGTVTLRDLRERQQEQLPVDQVVSAVRDRLSRGVT